MIKFSEVIYPESPRSAVIVGASQVDVELFENDRGLGTFSAKINIAYRLGLIDKVLKRALHIFRKIRNGFSHQVHGCSLVEQPYSNWLNEIIEYCREEIDINFDEGLDKFPSQYKVDESSDSLKLAITFILGKI